MKRLQTVLPTKRILLRPILLPLLLFTLIAGCQPITRNAATPPSHSASESGQVAANGITLAYESFGATDRETILLIAGTGMQLVDWPMELIDALVQRGYRVVRFDNRDIGLSTHLDEAGLPDSDAIGKALQAGQPAPLAYTLHDMAADAVGLLDALQIQQAHLVGISMGGAIAQLMAIDYPEHVLSLTLLMSDSGNPQQPVIANPDSFADVPPQPTTVDMESYIDWQVKTWQALSGPDYPTDEATLRQWAERDFARGYDPAGFARQGAAIVVDRYEASGYRHNHLTEIKTPTLVLQGTSDPIVPMDAATELAASVPGAELRQVPGLGHDSPPELVPLFVDVISATAERSAK
ncbi:MAG: alpha/beta hydrolase [Caldilineaceae bacterium]